MCSPAANPRVEVCGAVWSCVWSGIGRFHCVLTMAWPWAPKSSGQTRDWTLKVCLIFSAVHCHVILSPKERGSDWTDRLHRADPIWAMISLIYQRPTVFGFNGVPYRVYKGALDIFYYLWKIMVIVWKKGTIPRIWCQTGGIFILKEKNAITIGQFRSISLCSVWKERSSFVW